MSKGVSLSRSRCFATTIAWAGKRQCVLFSSFRADYGVYIFYEEGTFWLDSPTARFFGFRLWGKTSFLVGRRDCAVSATSRDRHTCTATVATAATVATVATVATIRTALSRCQGNGYPKQSQLIAPPPPQCGTSPADLAPHIRVSSNEVARG